MTAVVVDLDGQCQAMLRNGAPIQSSDDAFYKAYASASLTLSRNEDSTRAAAERMAMTPADDRAAMPLPNVTYAVGGLAIKVGDNIIGGLGIIGAPGGQFYEECGRAALAKVADRLK